MEIILYLEGHCIETAANKKYEKLARDLLKKDDKEREDKLDFLKEFLENGNFTELRSAGFNGSEEMKVRVIKENSNFTVKRME